MRFSGIIGVAWAGCFGPLGLHAALSPDYASELAANNPFFGPVPVEKIPAAPQFELRGVIKEKDGYLLNIYDPSVKKSSWVKEVPSQGVMPSQGVRPSIGGVSFDR